MWALIFVLLICHNVLWTKTQTAVWVFRVNSLPVKQMNSPWGGAKILIKNLLGVHSRLIIQQADLSKGKQQKGTRWWSADKSPATKWQTAKTSVSFICSIIKHEIAWLTLYSAINTRVPVHFREQHPQSNETCDNKDVPFEDYNCFHVALKIHTNMFSSIWALKRKKRRRRKFQIFPHLEFIQELLDSS